MVDAAGTVKSHHTVGCPRRHVSTPFARCCGCSRMQSIAVSEDGKHGSVDCGVDAERAARGPIDLAEAAVRVRLSDLLRVDTTCVRGEVQSGALADLLRQGKQRTFPVVDDQRRLVGIVSKTDLLRADLRDPTSTVADIMTPRVHGLPEDAPIAYAISLMASAAIHEVPVVDNNARVIGMLTSTDALRWVAQALGYVLPSSPAEAHHPAEESAAPSSPWSPCAGEGTSRGQSSGVCIGPLDGDEPPPPPQPADAPE